MDLFWALWQAHKISWKTKKKQAEQTTCKYETMIFVSQKKCHSGHMVFTNLCRFWLVSFNRPFLCAFACPWMQRLYRQNRSCGRVSRQPYLFYSSQYKQKPNLPTRGESMNWNEMEPNRTDQQLKYLNWHQILYSIQLQCNVKRTYRTEVGFEQFNSENIFEK